MAQWYCKRCLRPNEEHEEFCTTCGKERFFESNKKDSEKICWKRMNNQNSINSKKGGTKEKEKLFAKIPWGVITLNLILISLIGFVGFKDFCDLFECFPIIFIVLLMIMCFAFSVWIIDREVEKWPAGVPYCSQRFVINNLSCACYQLSTGIVTIWRKDDNLMFYNHKTKIISEVKISEIISFSIKGDIVRNEPSLTKAVIGDALFGAGGALVYSQGKEIDKRMVVLLFNYRGKTNHMILNSEAYSFLLNLIPEKEYSLVSQTHPSNSNCEKHDNNTEIELLKQLMDLKEKGVLTEEEFQQKKKQILNI